MLKILILSIAAVAFAIYMVKENEKGKHKLSGTKKKTTQDLMNVIDIDEQGIIIKANDKVKAADDPENMLKELS